jgi:hypothetical protein
LDKKIREKFQGMEGNMFELSTPIEEIENLGENCVILFQETFEYMKTINISYGQQTTHL